MCIVMSKKLNKQIRITQTRKSKNIEFHFFKIIIFNNNTIIIFCIIYKIKKTRHHNIVYGFGLHYYSLLTNIL